MKKKKSRKTTTKKLATVRSGTKLSGHVHLQYVQYSYPIGQEQAIVEALSQLLLSDYYRQFCHVNTVTNNDEF